MQFHVTGTDPTDNALLVCRNVRWSLLALLVVLWALPVMLWFAGGSRWIVGIVAAVPALITWPTLSAWRRRGRPDSWILAAHDDGLWLNLRDCDYRDAEPGESIVFIPYGELQAVRRYVHRYQMKHGNRTRHYKDAYLELQLQNATVSQVEVALAQEWKRQPPPRTHFGGNVTIRTRRTQAPVAVDGDERILVKFSAGNYGLRPSLGRVLERLKQYVQVASDREPPKEDWDNLEEPQFDKLIRRLATNGQRIDAMRMLRQRKDLSAKEARQFVDQLSGRD